MTSRFAKNVNEKLKSCFRIDLYKYVNRIKARYQNWRYLETTKTDFKPSYIGSRWDIVELVPESVRKVLDVGCSTGRLGEAVRQKVNKVEIAGIEIDERMAEVAREKLDKVIIADIEQTNLSNYFAPKYFDCIIFGDVLEHLKNPWDILKNATQVLNDAI
jgi:2-polyprenyl-3-methyl-5-hydroxy-6-metoxy-1,4-benzoquinol methylase